MRGHKREAQDARGPSLFIVCSLDDGKRPTTMLCAKSTGLCESGHEGTEHRCRLANKMKKNSKKRGGGIAGSRFRSIVREARAFSTQARIERFMSRIASLPCWLRASIHATLLAAVLAGASVAMAVRHGMAHRLSTADLRATRGSDPKLCAFKLTVSADACTDQLYDPCDFWPWCVTCRDGCTTVLISRQSGGLGIQSFGHTGTLNCGRLGSTYNARECTDLCFCSGAIISTNLCNSIDVSGWRSCLDPD